MKEQTKIMQTVGAQIRQRAANKNLDSIQLGELIGISDSTVRTAWRGGYNLSINVLAQYADALDCEAWELIKPLK